MTSAASLRWSLVLNSAVLTLLGHEVNPRYFFHAERLRSIVAGSLGLGNVPIEHLSLSKLKQASENFFSLGVRFHCKFCHYFWFLFYRYVSDASIIGPVLLTKYLLPLCPSCFPHPKGTVAYIGGPNLYSTCCCSPS